MVMEQSAKSHREWHLLFSHIISNAWAPILPAAPLPPKHFRDPTRLIPENLFKKPNKELLLLNILQSNFSSSQTATDQGITREPFCCSFPEMTKRQTDIWTQIILQYTQESSFWLSCPCVYVHRCFWSERGKRVTRTHTHYCKNTYLNIPFPPSKISKSCLFHMDLIGLF